MNEPITEVIAVMIPIVAIVMGIGIGMLSLLLDYRKKREMFAMHHKERLMAIEKGMEVPPLPPEFFQNGHRRPRSSADNLRRGLILLLVGAAIMVALYNTYNRTYLWGLVPAAIGIAQLLTYYIESRKAARE
jgi:Flp pilus assembly protein TadB